jgi:hypothetical protein
MNRIQIAAALAALAALAGCHDREAMAPTRDNFTAALDHYLAQRACASPSTTGPSS